MEVRVLGPVELVIDGRARSLPGPGERELLALLALSAGRVVAVLALVDGLWAEALPANPGNALQVRVSKLRRALAAAGAPGELVVTRPPGYLLHLDRGGVDALRFADQVAAARASADADPVTAAGLYREALVAWRGPALAEFADAAWAATEAAQASRRTGQRCPSASRRTAASPRTATANRWGEAGRRRPRRASGRRSSPAGPRRTRAA